MLNNTSTEQLQALYAQIEQVYASFRSLRGEAEGILETSDMPDSKSQLGDVLESTETATMAIITHASSISNVVAQSNLSEAARAEIDGHVSAIFESCSFQDITGQRIQKVMGRLHALEEQLQRLSSSAAFSATPARAEKDPLKNGPQLTDQAPDQAAIDRMFDEQ